MAILDAFQIEKINLLKVCPKLIKHHFELSNLSKTKVKYTVQVPITMNKFLLVIKKMYGKFLVEKFS